MKDTQRMDCTHTVLSRHRNGTPKAFPPIHTHTPVGSCCHERCCHWGKIRVQCVAQGPFNSQNRDRTTNLTGQPALPTELQVTKLVDLLEIGTYALENILHTFKRFFFSLSVLSGHSGEAEKGFQQMLRDEQPGF